MAVNRNADDYANTRMNIYFPGFPSSLTGQCVSLVKWFIGEMCGVADWQGARGNAKDFGDTLVNQGLAYVIDASQRSRGDIVVWKQDGGGYGHIGLLCSGDNVFEENVGIAGAASQVFEGTRVYASRLDPLSSSWRKGPATYYRMRGYAEFINATYDQIQSLYQELLGRAADAGGLDTYTQQSVDQARANIMTSNEYSARQQALAQQAAQAAADKAAALAQEQAEAQAQADAAAKAAQKAADYAAKAAAEAAAAQQVIVSTPTIPVTTNNSIKTSDNTTKKPNWVAQLVISIIVYLTRKK